MFQWNFRLIEKEIRKQLQNISNHETAYSQEHPYSPIAETCESAKSLAKRRHSAIRRAALRFRATLSRAALMGCAAKQQMNFKAAGKIFLGLSWIHASLLSWIFMDWGPRANPMTVFCFFRHCSISLAPLISLAPQFRLRPLISVAPWCR